MQLLTVVIITQPRRIFIGPEKIILWPSLPLYPSTHRLRFVGGTVNIVVPPPQPHPQSSFANNTHMIIIFYTVILGEGEEETEAQLSMEKYNIGNNESLIAGRLGYHDVCNKLLSFAGNVLVTIASIR